MLLCSGAVQAQHARKANKFYKSALKNWSHYHRQVAYKKMSRSITKAPKSPAGYSQLGEWYFEQHHFGEAVKVFAEASVKCPNGGKLFAKPLARSLLYAGMADSGLQVIARYANNKDTAGWNALRRQALFIKKAMLNSQAQLPASLGPYINGKYPDVFPSLSADSTTLYFTRRVKNMDEDFYVAHYDTSCKEWLAGENMGAPPNTIDNESAQFISADGHYLFFCRSDNRSENGWAEGGYDLFMAYRIAYDSNWTIPQFFGGTINTPDYEGMPSLSPDNRELYFVSDRAGGYGGLDIWVSKFEDNLWQLPVNAGPGINTAGDETAPYICYDNKTLFFTSNGRPGMGGTDIYESRRINDTTWATAVNLGYPINTACDEESEWIVTDGTKMIFGSDRQGPAGNFDLYETKLPEGLTPDPVGYLKGIVFDSISKAKLNSATIYLMNAKTGDTIYQFRSNRGDASFLIPVSTKIPYAMHTTMIGYTEVMDTFAFDKQHPEAQLERNVSMLPSDYVKPIFDSLIAVIHFDINKVELTDSDNVLLGRAIEPFLLDKGLTIYVNGFTDNTGTPMLNDELSTKRANMVSHALTAIGIEELSIIAKGWGEAKMIAPNDTEENQRKNRRVEIRLRRE